MNEAVRLRTASVSADKVIKAARKLVQAAGVFEPPVDLNLLARMQGVREILLVPLNGADAKLTPVPDGFVIRVDLGAPVTMRRFSIAHEIGHTFFNHNHESFRNQTVRLTSALTGGEYRLEEELCDRAAAELLMPEEMFRQEAGSKLPSIDLFTGLSGTFETSLKSTVIRYASLFESSSQILMWRKRGVSLKGSWTRGATVLVDRERVVSLEEPEGDVQSAIVEAYSATHRINSWQADGCRRVLVDAKAFGAGDERYVLSVLTSPTTFA